MRQRERPGVDPQIPGASAWEVRGGRSEVRSIRRAADPVSVRPGREVLVPGLLAVAVVAMLAGTLVRVATLPVPERVMLTQRVVGPDGGTVGFDGGGRIVIPRGALDEPRTITVWSRIGDTPLDGEGATVGRYRLYEFEPEDVRFSARVSIFFPMPVRDRDATVVLTVDGEARRIAGHVDPTTGLVEIQTTSFGFDAGGGPAR